MTLRLDINIGEEEIREANVLNNMIVKKQLNDMFGKIGNNEFPQCFYIETIEREKEIMNRRRESYERLNFYTSPHRDGLFLKRNELLKYMSMVQFEHKNRFKNEVLFQKKITHAQSELQKGIYLLSFYKYAGENEAVDQILIKCREIQSDILEDITEKGNSITVNGNKKDVLYTGENAVLKVADFLKKQYEDISKIAKAILI